MKRLSFFVIIFIGIFIFSLKVNALEDGIYTIHSAINPNYVLDLNGANAVNGGNIQLYNSNKTNAQKFKITSLENGYYEISSLVNSNYVLDVSGANFNNLTNIQIYSTNNSNAQKWIIKPTNNGMYYIYSYDNIHCLDVDSGIAVNYRNVQLYNFNGTLAQQFSFEKNFEAKQTIRDGLYSISTKKNENMFVGLSSDKMYNSNNVQLYNNEFLDIQKWFIKYLGNGYYSIKPYLSLNYSIDVAGAGKSKGTNAQLYQANGTDAQKWIIYDNGDGFYNIVSVCNNLVLDFNGDAINNTNIYVNEHSAESESQKFKFNIVVEKGKKTINDGYYFINSSINENKVLDIQNGGISQFNNVQIYNLNFSLAQKWYIKYLNDGYYSILSDKDNNFALERDPNSLNVRINNYTNTENQKWIIKQTGNYYYIISDDGKYLDLASASTVNGNNIGVFEPNTTLAQKFNFRKTASGLSNKVLQDGFYTISSSLDSYYLLETAGGGKTNYTNVQLYKNNGTRAQKWKIHYMDNGYYKISSVLDFNKSLDVSGAGYNNGTNVQIYDNNNSFAQQWIIKDAGDGYFYIISNCNGLYVEAAGGAAGNGTNIQMYEENLSNAQKFKFSKTRLENLVVDVSRYQGIIDWDTVKNEAGIYGTILRVSASAKTEDSMLARNSAEVKSKGIPYGIYIFSYAENEAEGKLYGEFVKKMISKYNLDSTLGIYLDLEWNNGYMNQSDYENVVRGFMSVLPNAKIYTNLSYARTYLNTPFIKPYITWIAQWNSTCTYDGYYKMWQFTNNGSLPGIDGRVDLNYYYLD